MPLVAFPKRDAGYVYYRNSSEAIVAPFPYETLSGISQR
jgi:hypothetical protein